MAKALYRKYRPRKIAEVVGQSQVTDILAGSLDQGRISHAYLFIGPRGTGKTSVARIFAHEVNGFDYEVEDDYVDIIEIDGASNRGIDDVRELREKALIAPTSGKYKVYIIDEVHMLTKEAFNALLKILEEPPKHVIFIMATTDAHKVPVTITSRAQVYTFALADFETMLEFLKSVAEKEKIKIDDEALGLIVKRGGGSFRDSLSLLDQISTLTSELITKEMIVAALGLPADEKIGELLSEYLNGDVVKITMILKKLLSSGVKPETLAEEIISYILENPKPEYFALLEKLPEVKAPFVEAKLLVALCGGSVGAACPSDTLRAAQAKSSWSAEHIAPTLPPAIHKKTSSPALASENSRLGAFRSAAARELAPAARGDGPAGRGPEREFLKPGFSWDEFVEQVKEANDAVVAQLLKCEHKFENETLVIYPPIKIVKTILTKDKNKQILVDKAGVKVVIEDVGKNETKDDTIAKLSDIMGGEVRNDTGGNPF